ncbi:hypothetical protein [Cryobacterium sp. PH29-G1]|uniref:hypothetical protein n=1 Tax=Cryobacterium sp. PH29-G1 TaxID=3046211 RepID=UPI0024BB127F|nr:hypothetical protein [Cryobacterium sp. PH29-G1]MDJ0349366.1 hypothetical protein [Cryobacterium sp. PH29-G1]
MNGEYRPRIVGDQGDIAVVAEQAEGVAECRIHVAVGECGRIECCAHERGQGLGDVRTAAEIGSQPVGLRVGPKPTGGTVNLGQDGIRYSARRSEWKRLILELIADHERGRSAPDRPLARGGRHVTSRSIWRD